MKRKFRFMFPLLLVALPLSGCTIISIKDEDDSESGTIIVDNFYKDYNLKKTGGRLIQELQRMCWDKHTNWITYSQTWSYFAKTDDRNSVDAISDGSEKVELFYTGAEKLPQRSYTYNREHVWPCANSSTLWTHDKPDAGSFSPHYVDYTYYVGGGSDLLHLRPANDAVNEGRGNSLFVDFDDPECVSYKDNIIEKTESGGKYPLYLYGSDSFSNRAEPHDKMKGDVARIVLYVYVHYQERGDTPEKSVISGGKEYKYSDMTGTLSLRNIMGYETEERCLEVLQAWNKLDPPSSVEKLRNDTVQKIQGNRNPFVDYPELVDRICE
jgi:endonuclease I